MEQVYLGKVVWFNPKKSYGFISWEGKEDMFVHFSDIMCEGFRTLKKGQCVTFSIGENNHGEPKAIEVSVIDEG
jgi:CspA family cold shock protein